MRKSTRNLVPTCLTLDARLAPSGNFLAHDFHAVADAVKGVEHRVADHHATDATHHEGMKVHYHHIAK